MKQRVKYYLQKLTGLFLNEPIILPSKTTGYSLVKSQKDNFISSDKACFFAPYYFFNVILNDYSYIAKNSNVTNTEIGKFCSIGPNFCCGLGIHPTNGISTSPMFYSTAKQNGYTLVAKSKIVESKKIVIGNDVYIGANVTILDGITIGNGAIIGAGAVVTEDIPPFAVAVGIPAKVVKFRFSEKKIEELLKIQWWNFDENQLQNVEKYFFDIDIFIERYIH